jgi:hypothetical protein
MNKVTLFTISAEQQRINDALMESGGELTPELEEALIINTENFSVKVEGYATSIHQFEAFSDAADAEIKRLTALKKSAQSAIKRLKDNLAYGMEVMGYDKVDMGLHKLSFRSSTAVNITDEVRIPSQYIKVETKIDKESLKRDLKAGLVIEGAELTTNKTIQIR